MKKGAYTFLIFLAFALLANGQEKSIVQFDLFGGWVLTLHETEQNEGKLIYKKQKDSNTEFKQGISILYFQAFEECKMATYWPIICGNELSAPNFSWTFEEDTGIISIHSSKQLLKEFKEKYPEEHERFGSPKEFDEIQLKVIALADGTNGLERLHLVKLVAN